MSKARYPKTSFDLGSMEEKIPFYPLADLGTLDILGYCGTALPIAVQQLLRASVRVAPPCNSWDGWWEWRGRLITESISKL